MTNNQFKKCEAESHNKAYEESKKPKAQYKRSRIKTRKTRKAQQMLAIMMEAQGRSLSGGV